MPRDVARDALYSGQVNLWVEDALTRAYLDGLWNDSAVKFLIGGGRDGVGAILKDAEDTGYTNVFGVIDRDFQPSNRGRLDEPGQDFPKVRPSGPRSRELPSRPGGVAGEPISQPGPRCRCDRGPHGRKGDAALLVVGVPGRDRRTEAAVPRGIRARPEAIGD